MVNETIISEEIIEEPSVGGENVILPNSLLMHFVRNQPSLGDVRVSKDWSNQTADYFTDSTGHGVKVFSALGVEVSPGSFVVPASGWADFIYTFKSNNRFFLHSWAGSVTGLATGMTFTLFVDDIMYETVDAPPQNLQSWFQTQIPPDMANLSVRIRFFNGTGGGVAASAVTVAMRGWLRAK